MNTRPVADRSVSLLSSRRISAWRGISVLELVHENALEALLEALPDTGVALDEIPSLQEQIEKIKGTGMGLCLLVSLDTAAKFFMQACCQIGICIGLEMG